MRFFGNPFHVLILTLCFGLSCLFAPLSAGEQGKGKAAREAAENAAGKTSEKIAEKGKKLKEAAEAKAAKKKITEKGAAAKKTAKKAAAKAEKEKGKAEKKVKEKGKKKVKLGPLAKEKTKHIKRLAKIDRLEQIARKKNNEKLLKQIQMLREKENRRHEKVMARLSSVKAPKTKEKEKEKEKVKDSKKTEESEEKEKATEE